MKRYAGAVLALGLSSACAVSFPDLPLGTGGASGSGPTTIRSLSAGIPFATGNAMQHHLLAAYGAWWLLVPDAAGVEVLTSKDFQTWTTAPALDAGGAMPASLTDGRNLAVGLHAFATGTVVHVAMATAAGLYHGRGLITPEAAALALDGAPALVASNGNDVLVDAPAVLVTAGNGPNVVDVSGLGFLGGASPCIECGYRAQAPDTGETSWSNGFDPSADIGIGSTAAAARGAVPLGSNGLILYQGSGEFVSSTLYAGTLTKAALVTGFSTKAPASAWAACATGNAATLHLVGRIGKAFWHETSGGAGWGGPPNSKPGLPLLDDLSTSPDGPLFLACGASHVHAFTKGMGDSIEVATWGPDSGWGHWRTLVAADGNLRCGLTGHDRVGPNGSVGLVWSVASGASCLTSPPSTSIAGILATGLED